MRVSTSSELVYLRSILPTYMKFLPYLPYICNERLCVMKGVVRGGESDGGSDGVGRDGGGKASRTMGRGSLEATRTIDTVCREGGRHMY